MLSTSVIRLREASPVRLNCDKTIKVTTVAGMLPLASLRTTRQSMLRA